MLFLEEIDLHQDDIGRRPCAEHVRIQHVMVEFLSPGVPVAAAEVGDDHPLLLFGKRQGLFIVGVPLGFLLIFRFAPGDA